MASGFARTKTFDPGTLGANLATFDQKVDRAVTRLTEEAAARGESDLKQHAPWHDRTWRARNTLWSVPTKTSNGRYGISMGHGVRYGIFLEKSNDGRFQIVMPTIVATARSLMRSMEHLFAELREGEATTPALAPSEGIRQGSSQTLGTRVRNAHEKVKRAIYRDARGRFTSRENFMKAQGATKRTKRTRRG